ncbi:MAG: flagellar type III secretion system pore protein FliP [Bdellovibrionales bacterium]|nr:flagellar type III secretion system pore protein FliP [Bdellovibrionales bacterium]
MTSNFARRTISLGVVLGIAAFVASVFWALPAHADAGNPSFVPGTSGLALPGLSLSFNNPQKPQEVVSVLRIMMMLTVLSLAPAILIMMTSFTRIVVVLSFLRQALGTQQMPPNQLIVGLSLFVSFFVMAPTWKQVSSGALEPFLNEKIDQTTALSRAEAPLRKFMFAQTREKDLELFLNLSKEAKPKTREDVPTYVLIPAFVISELKTAFQIGFMIYLPFLVLDMVVASVLMAMGMMMLPPAVIALPFKLLLFVLVDGWELVIGSLVKSFG